MTGKTHIAFNTVIIAAIGAAGAINLHSPGAGTAALIGGVMLGSILPDIDSPNSKINHMLRRVFLPKGFRRSASGAARSFSSFHHRRNFPHWPLFWFFACMMLYLAFRTHPLFTNLFAGLAIGTAAHLFCDMFNPYGIMLLAPFSRKTFRIASIPTSSMGELLFLIASILAAALLAVPAIKIL